MGEGGFDGLSVDPFGLSNEPGGLVVAVLNSIHKPGQTSILFNSRSQKAGITPLQPL